MKFIFKFPKTGKLEEIELLKKAGPSPVPLYTGLKTQMLHYLSMKAMQTNSILPVSCGADLCIALHLKT